MNETTISYYDKKGRLLQSTTYNTLSTALQSLCNKAITLADDNYETPVYRIDIVRKKK